MAIVLNAPPPPPPPPPIASRAWLEQADRTCRTLRVLAVAGCIGAIVAGVLGVQVAGGSSLLLLPAGLIVFCGVEVALIIARASIATAWAAQGNA